MPERTSMLEQTNSRPRARGSDDRDDVGEQLDGITPVRAGI